MTPEEEELMFFSQVIYHLMINDKGGNGDLEKTHFSVTPAQGESRNALKILDSCLLHAGAEMT